MDWALCPPCLWVHGQPDLLIFLNLYDPNAIEFVISRTSAPKEPEGVYVSN